mgnify:CR=1 FL=1
MQLELLVQLELKESKARKVILEPKVIPVRTEPKDIQVPRVTRETKEIQVQLELPVQQEFKARKVKQALLE